MVGQESGDAPLIPRRDARAPAAGPRAETHRRILRPQGLDALANITIVNITAVDFHEVFEGSIAILRAFVRSSQFVVQGCTGFLVERRKLECLVIPADGGFWNAFVEETLGEPGISLHELWEGVAAID